MRTRSLLVLLLAVAAVAQTPALSGAEGRLSNGNVSVVTPPGWRTLTRSELGAVDPPPVIALVRSDSSSFQIVKAKLVQKDWTPSQVAGASMALILLEFKNGSVETPLHATTLAGLPAAEWTATYTIKNGADGHARMISVISGESYYTIAASGPVAAKGELDELIKSVVIGR